MHNSHPQHWYDFDMMRAPGFVRLALEWRAPWEFGATMLAIPWLNQLPDGDGHPVIVFPGLMASDASTKPLRRFLERKRYSVMAGTGVRTWARRKVYSSTAWIWFANCAGSTSGKSA